MTYLPPLQPGLSTAGDGMPVYGRLRNLAASELTTQTAGITWEHEVSATEQPDSTVNIYVDGQLRATPTAGSHGADITSLAAGDSSAQLILSGVTDNPSARSTDPDGQNALLSWAPSISPDCVGYRIYHDTDLLATVRTVAAQERVSAPPDTGVGNGTISAWGRITDYAGNNSGALTVTGSGIAEWAFPGYETAAIEFNRGTVATLTPGFTLTFNSDPENYETGDLWNIYVGPQTHYVTDALTPGEHLFSVSAIDAAGNESAQIAASAVYIAEIPGSLTAVTTEYALDTLSVAFILPANADGVNIYTNFNPHTGEFEPYIVTDGLPYATSDALFNFSAPVSTGQLKYYLRPYNTTAERQDSTLYTFNFPPGPDDVGVALSDPTGLTATPASGGKWRLEWDYRLTVDSAATGFHIYRHSTDAAIDYTADLLTTVPLSAGSGAPVVHFTYNHATAEVSPIRLSVRTSNGTIETLNTDYVLLTPDAAAPALSGPVIGGPA